MITPNEHGETPGSIIDLNHDDMTEDWKQIVLAWEDAERRLRYLENNLEDFWSNWLAKLDDPDRAGNFR